jgi:hypothetical protein
MDRVAKPTAYAKSKISYKNINENYIYHWWLRSPSYNQKRAEYIDTDGDIEDGSIGTSGVRPAMWVKLDNPQ